MAENNALFTVSHLCRFYKTDRHTTLRAVDDVSFDIREGETLGLVGESGCGKTTCGRTVIGLYGKTSGNVLYGGKDVHKLKGIEKKRFKKDVQMVFQDAYSSLDPRMTVGDIVAEGIDIHRLANNRKERTEMIHRYLDMVGLSDEHAGRFAHEFSGGQRQRIGIARSLALDPKFILLDEPISALDVSIQAQVINLLMHLQQELKLTYFFIAHDLSVVRLISDRVAVMYLGNLVELTTSDELYFHPQHPYTQALYSAIPMPDPQRAQQRRAEKIILSDEIGANTDDVRGCKFQDRCKYTQACCKEVQPELKEFASGHFVACHMVG